MKPPRIVVIDDSPSSLSLYRRGVEPLEVELQTFLSAYDALAFLTRNEADLIFLDILMREGDGHAVLRALRRLVHHRRTSVVVVTSKDYHQDRFAARQVGVLDYLIKPVRSQELRELICRHTGIKTGVVEARAE